MKPSLAILTMIAALAVPGMPVQAAAPATVFRNLEAGKAQTVIVYGTSLTHGGAWATATRKWFDQQYPGKVNFINSGGPGQNSDWGLGNLKSKVLDHHPDLVFVEFSFNDAHTKFNMPVERGAANLRKIVEGIRGQNPDTVIVLQIMNVPWDAPNGQRSQSNRPELEKFNDNYRTVAREQGLPLIDHSVAWEKLRHDNPGMFKWYVPDGTHPSPEGSLAVTWPTIKAWLETARSAAKTSEASGSAK